MTLLVSLYKIYVSAYSTPNYQVTSLNAFNIWGLGGMWVSDTQGFFFITPNIIGWVMFGTFTAFTLYFVHKRISANEELTVLFAAFVLFFGFFMLPTQDSRTLPLSSHIHFGFDVSFPKEDTLIVLGFDSNLLC